MTRRAPQHAAGIAALTVNKADAKFLQDFLAQKYSLSRRAAKAMIDGRSVWVNRKCVWIARYALKTGDLVEVPTAVVKGAQRMGIAAAAAIGKTNAAICKTRSGAGGEVAGKAGSTSGSRHIRVLWGDENYLVCDKPAGVVSCDDPRSAESILREQEKIPTLVAVHRLDRDTTGCLLFAKSHAAFLAAVEVFKTHKVSKIYQAVVVGKFAYAHQVVETPIDGQPAVSRISREAVGADASFLRVRIETGRTNQIRRHLASIRFPILGDRVFGLKRARDPRLLQVPRQMLHAATLTLPNPLAPKTEIKVHSPLPADFRATLRLFGMGK